MAGDARPGKDLAALLAADPVRDLDGLEVRREPVLLELLQRPLHGGGCARRSGESRPDGVGQLLQPRIGDAVGQRAAHQLVGNVGRNGSCDEEQCEEQGGLHKRGRTYNAKSQERPAKPAGCSLCTPWSRAATGTWICTRTSRSVPSVTAAPDVA